MLLLTGCVSSSEYVLVAKCSDDGVAYLERADGSALMIYPDGMLVRCSDGEQ